METIQLEWLNQNSLRAYPIREDCARIPCDSGGNPTDPLLSLPNCVITDFVLVRDSSFSGDIYVRHVSYFGSFLNISIAAGDAIIATIGVNLDRHTKNSVYRFSCVGDYEASSGAITIGDLSNIGDLLPEGQYYYTSSQTAFEESCIRPAIKTVTGISTYDIATGYKSLPLHGDVILKAGSNIKLDYDRESNCIIVSAADGAGYTEDCVCNDYTSCIKWINGINAERVTLTGEGCLTVSSDDNTGVITIKDTCAQPCCGCAELAFINDKISEIQTAIGNLSAYAGHLSAAATAFNAMKALGTAIGA